VDAEEEEVEEEAAEDDVDDDDEEEAEEWSKNTMITVTLSLLFFPDTTCSINAPLTCTAQSDVG
jgi:hypothetical protein